MPRWQFAYLDDRIRVFEGRPQRFGTQIDLKPEGAASHELADPDRVEAWREEVGLTALAVALDRARADPRPTAEEYAAKQAEGRQWRRKAGWIM